MNYIIAAIAIAGTILNVKQKRAGFAIWCITNAYWIAHNISISEWAQAAIYTVNFALALWGFFRWKTNNEMAGQRWT